MGNNAQLSNKSALHPDRVVLLASGLLLVAMLAAIIAGRRQLALVAIGLPLAAVAISNPRLALSQFIFCIFLQIRLTDQYPVNLVDVSAALVILAAVLDVLLDRNQRYQIPRLLWNFAFLLGAIAVATLFSIDPSRATGPLTRVVVIMATFAAVHRLSSKASMRNLLKVYFWTAVIHAGYVVLQFVLASGAARVFGFSPSTFGTLAMTAIPIGVAFAFSENRRHTLPYLAGSLVLMAGIVATQSRFPLLMSLLLATTSVIWRLRHRPFEPGSAAAVANHSLRSKALLLASVFVVGGVGLVVLRPAGLESVLERFDRLWTLSPTGTMSLRLTLWSFAVEAFLRNPILGIGPGCFRTVQEILPGLRLNELAYWIRGLSAHNLFLHYLAETGVIGAGALTALVINQFRLGRRPWLEAVDGIDRDSALALSTASAMFLITTFVESGWLWGQTGFVFAFFLALIACNADASTDRSKPPQA